MPIAVSPIDTKGEPAEQICDVGTSLVSAAIAGLLAELAIS